MMLSKGLYEQKEKKRLITSFLENFVENGSSYLAATTLSCVSGYKVRSTVRCCDVVSPHVT